MSSGLVTIDGVQCFVIAAYSSVVAPAGNDV